MAFKYTDKQKEAIIQDICYKMTEQGLSLRSILKSDDMPTLSTFFRWVAESEQYARAYEVALQARADMIFEDMFNILDATEDDVIINEDGVEVVNHNVIQRDRLRIDGRKWILGRMNPKKYGDRMKIDADVKTEIKPIMLVDAPVKKIKKG